LSEAQSYRVLIADDHPLFRGALREAVNRLFDRVEVAWQGIYVAEHRTSPHRREVVLQFCGSCANSDSDKASGD